MPRGRPKKIKVEELAVEEVNIEGEPVVEVESTQTVEEQKPVIMPTVGGVAVVSILNDGQETETHFHCAMADGTTMHVEKRLFQ